MALSMAEIRAKLKAQEDKAAGGQTGGFSNEPQAFLAHWNIAEGVPLNLRFLPDADANNDYFWKEREMITLWFNGIKGGDQKRTKVVVPCNEMWGPVNSCPVLREVREWYKAKDPALEEMARSYWKKKSYLFQVMIGPNSTPVEGDVAPENPIRRVILNKPLFNKVKSILLDPDLEHIPCDLQHGVDFSIIKGKQGQYASYDQSQWKRSSRPLSAEEMAAIDKHGLFTLEEFMPKQPTDAELNAIAEMFEASVNGEAYDPARWAHAYRPQGVQKPATGGQADSAPAVSAAAVAQAAAAPVAQAPVQEAAPATNATAALGALMQSNGGTAAAAAVTTPETQVQPAKPAASTSTADLLAQLQNRA